MDLTVNTESFADADAPVHRLSVSVHKYLPLAVLYFFFNSVGLPLGMFYTTLLAPLFYIWLRSNGQRYMTQRFLLCLFPFVAMQLSHGVDSYYYYFRSCLLLWTVYTTVYMFYIALRKTRTLDKLFEQLIVLNFFAALFALGLVLTPFKMFVWNDSEGVLETPGYLSRLALLNSEPSVYGFLMAPLLVFTILRMFHLPSKRNMLYVGLIAFPVLLSQSFGTISTCSAAIVISFVFMSPHLLKKKSTILLVLVVVLLTVVVMKTSNPLSLRINAVLSGEDSSTHSRTDKGYFVAYTLAASKSLLWGVGLGQTKLQDASQFVGLGFLSTIIPNGIAGTFAELGLIAVILKLIFELFLFARARVYRNSFQLSMYIVAFLLQFTGSHLMNVQEYLLWILAFTPLFPMLNRQQPPVAAAETCLLDGPLAESP
jgi:hypothetical protein